MTSRRLRVCATRCAAVFAACLFSTTAATAATETFGPSAYLSAADSPFNAVTFSLFVLEDFEDGALNTLGVSSPSSAIVIGPDPQADSVDFDDGAIDGDGSDGHSLYTNFVGTSLVFEFSALALGTLPTHAGLVWTDVGLLIGPGTEGEGVVRVEAFDLADQLIASIEPGTLGDGSTFGGTAEDRFFGFRHDAGIASLVLSMPNSSDFEIDHLQYGIAPVPLPASIALLAPALLLLRKRTG